MEEKMLLLASRWSDRIDAVAITALRILLILVVAWVVIRLLRRAIRGFHTRVAARMDDREAIKRAETLGRVADYAVAVIVSLIAGMLMLGELGVSVAPILGAAGVAGIAVGFGAQSLVKDYFNGFFILIENQIRQGDVVKLGDHAGLVEEVTLRYVQLRDYDGNVHLVPNGMIGTVVNMSRGYAQAVLEVRVALGADLDHALAVFRQVADELRADASFGPRILADFDLAGVERWDDSAIVLRGRFQVQPLEQWNVRREFLRRLKIAFDAQGIEIPTPYLTLKPLRGARAEGTREVA